MVKYRKLKTGDIKNKPLERWLSFFDKETPEEILKEVVKMDSAISKANDRLNFVSQDKEFLRTYHMREMALSDWTTGINTATEKGIEIGIERGIEKNKIDVAKSALAEGASIEFIKKITNLDEKTILSLK